MGMNPTKKIRSTVRNTKRVSEVLTVLISHGFENVLIETGLARLFGKGRRLIGSKNKKSNIDQPWASRLRQVLEELGPTFIKMGQILATRPDLIPVTWAEEFKKLQSGAPSVEFAKIEAKLEDAFGSQFEDLFESVDPNPLGSASIAQVHRGVLKTGERVVIKIVKPGIKNTIKADMEVLAMMAGLVEHHFSNLGYSPKQVAREFSRELNREVNLMNEGQSCDRLNMLFQDSKKVSFPKVYWEATNSDVLTMSEAEGTLLSQLNRDDMELPLRQELLKTGADAIFRQCLEFGFFHADPHPGNLFVKEDGSITFIDCGMTGRIERKTQELLADLVMGISSNDLEMVIDVVLALGQVDPRMCENRAFRSDISEFISRFQTGTLESMDIAAMLQDFFDLLREYNIQCPADLVFLIKALTTIEGVGEALDPDFNLIATMRPYIEKLVRDRYGPKKLFSLVRRMALSYTDTLDHLPRDWHTLMYMIKNNELRVNLDHSGADKFINEISFASRNVAAALIIAALLVGSSILVLADRNQTYGIMYIVGALGVFTAAISTMTLIVFNFWHRRR